MRRLAPAIAVLALVATGAPVRATPVPPGFASPNVEWVANVPLDADTSGARIHGKRLYVTNSRALTIYDISVPDLPVPMSVLPMPQMPYYPEEDVDTNGRIVLIGSLGDLKVVDVSNGRLPALLATLPDADAHTVTCLLDCKWAYTNAGHVIDLRNPAKPKVAGDWKKHTRSAYAHDVTEVAPGLVVTSSQPMLLLDARRDPAHPRVLARAGNRDKRFMHANLWPRGGTDRFLLAGGETTSRPSCSDPEAGAFMVWDTTGWKSKGTFKLVGEYRAPDGLPHDGGAPTQTYCAHWFTTAPGWRNGGLVAMGWYEHGTRFLEVNGRGQVKEIGWFIPAGTSVSAAYWVTKDLVYLLDYNRGLDIVRLHRDGSRAPLRTPTPPRVTFPTLRPSYQGVCPLPV